MSFNNPVLTQKDLEKQWELYSLSPSQSIFLNICNQWHSSHIDLSLNFLNNQKLQHALTTTSQNIMSSFKSGSITPDDTFINLSPILFFMHYSVNTKDCNLAISASYLEFLFEFVLFCLRKPEISLETNSKLMISALMLIEATIEKQSTKNQDIMKILNFNMNYLFEETVKPQMNEIVSFIIYLPELNKAFVKVREEFTDVFVVVLEIYLSFTKIIQKVFNKTLLHPILANLILAIKNNQDISNMAYSQSAKLATKKFTLLMSIIISLSKQKNVCGDFFHEFREKFKEIFIACAAIFSGQLEEIGGSILDDKNPLAEIFRASFGALSCLHDEKISSSAINDVPIICQLLLSIYEFPKAYQVVLKIYCLDLVYLMFFNNVPIASNILNLGIIELLFTYEFFIIDDRRIYNYWCRIWECLEKNHKGFEKICRCIIQSLQSNISKVDYLDMFNLWLYKLIESPKNLSCIELIRLGLVTEISNQLVLAKDIEIYIRLNQILQTLISQCNNEKIDQLIIVSKLLFTNIKNSERDIYLEPSISRLLSFNQDKVFKFFIEFCSKQHQIFSALSLISFLRKALIEKGFKEFISVNQYEPLVFKTIINIIPKKDFNEDQIRDVWKAGFECLASILLRSELPYLEDEAYNTLHLLDLFRLEEYMECKLRIIEDNFANLVDILLDTGLNRIKFPWFIPVLAEFLFINFEQIQNTYRKRVKKMATSEDNIELMGKYGFLSICFSNLMKKNNLKFLKKYSNLFQKLIAINFTVYDINSYLLLIKSSSNNEFKKKLLEILTGGLERLISTIHANKFMSMSKDNNFENVLKLNDNKYKEQTSKPIRLTEITLQKEFSLLLWVFPLDNSKSCITEIVFQYGYICIFISNYLVFIDFNGVVLEVKQQLTHQSWNLISINFLRKTVAKVLKNNMVMVFINEKLAELREKKSIVIAKSNQICKIKIGNSFDNKYPFAGKISSILVLKKCIENEAIKELCRLGPSFLTGECLEYRRTEWTKLLSEMKESTLLDVLEQDFANDNYNRGVIKVSNINAFESLKAYGLQRFLIEIFENIEGSSIFNRFFLMVHKLIQKNDKVFFINLDIIKTLAYFFTQVQLNEELCNTLQEILSISEDLEVKILIKAIVYHENLHRSFNDNKIIMKKFKSLYDISKESLYDMVVFIESSNRFGEIFKSFLKNMESFNIVGNLLVKIQSDNKYELVKKIINALLDINIKEILISDLSVSLLHILEFSNDVNIKKQIIELLVIKNAANNGKAIESSSNDIIIFINIIDDLLPDQLEEELVLFLLQKGFQNDSPLSNYKYLLIDIVMKRFSKSFNKEIIVSQLSQNSNNLSLAIFERDIYPLWLERYTEKLTFADSFPTLERIIKLSFNPPDFSAFKKFIELKPDPRLFLSFLPMFLETEFIYNYLLIFPALQACLKSDPQAICTIFELLSTSKTLFTMLLESLPSINIYALQRLEHMPLILHYLTFLTSAQKSLVSISQPFPFLIDFLSKKEINYFNTFEASTIAVENFVTLFILVDLLEYSEDDQIKNSQVFKDFILKSNVVVKTRYFFDSYPQLVQDKLREEILTKPGASMEKADIDAQILMRRIELKKCLDALSENFEGKTFEIGDLLTSGVWRILYQILMNIFNCSQSTCRVPDFPDMTREFSAMNKLSDFNSLLKAIRNLDWAEAHLAYIDRFKYKLKQDFQIASKRIACLQSIKSDEPWPNIKIRQVYDKFYRWSSVKPLRPKKKLQHTLSDTIPPVNFTSRSHIRNQTATPISSINNSFSDLSSMSRELTIQPQNFQHPEIFKGFIERIKVQGSYFGRVTITKDILDLNFEGQIKPPIYEFAGALEFSKVSKIARFIWEPSEVAEVHMKRFIHKHTALEFILKNGRSYYINFFSEKKREEALKIIEDWGSRMVKCSLTEVEKAMGLWKKGEMSNFEYLSLLNIHSGRSNNDLSQYPVFPWVLKEYSNKILDLEDPEVYRSFKFPIGSQKTQFQESLIEKYSVIEDQEESYHHGSHYSNAGILLHYLLRLEPYTSQSAALQGGNFDCADRLFISLENAWKSCTSVIGCDVKELVPETFFNSFILKSFTQQEFGTLQTGEKVKDVIPPKWAKSNWDFIIKHRNALESVYVNKKLCKWIDLIFGYKQLKPHSVAAINVFTPATYEHYYKIQLENHESDEIFSLNEQVYHFGQCPLVLFPKFKHPKKDEADKSNQIHKLFYCNSDNDLILKKVHKSDPRRGQVHSIFYEPQSIILIKTLQNSAFICKFKFRESFDMPSFHSELPLQGYYLFTRINLHNFSSSHNFETLQPHIDNSTFSIFNNKYLISGFDRSFAVQVHDLKGILHQSLLFHTNLVKSVTTCSEFIISSSIDSTIRSWRLDKERFVGNIGYFGHDSCITAVKVLESFNVLVSASVQCIVLIHDLRTGECLRMLKEKVKMIDVNEIGIIALAQRDCIKYIGVNGDLISKYSIFDIIKAIRLSPCGRFVIESYKNSIVIRDIIKYKKEIVEQQSAGYDIYISQNQKLIYVVGNGKTEDEGFIDLYRVVSNKVVVAQHNIINDLI